MPYTPWTDRNVGIEMEMNCETTSGQPLSLAHLEAAVRGAAGMPVQNRNGYGHSSGSAWEVKTDGSCGWEIASPILRFDADGECEELRNVTNALAARRPRIDRRCGVHVWIEVRDFGWNDLRKLLALWTRYEPFFFEMLPPSRRNNMYCRPMRSTAFGGSTEHSHWTATERAINASNASEFDRCRNSFQKYSSLNISRFWDVGRIEFRLHSGTVDYTKLRNWTKLLLALVNRAKDARFPTVSKTDFATQPSTFSTYYVCKVLGLIPSKYERDMPASNGALVDWIEARRRLFNAPDRLTRTGRRSAAVAGSEALDASETGTTAATPSRPSLNNF